jgi:prevent-host-death family protein
LTNLVRPGRLLIMSRKPVVRETVSLYQAKTQLSRLVDRAAGGEEIVISKSGRPRARLVPLEDARALRVPGKGKGKWRAGKEFDAPLPDAVIRDFEGDR